MNAATETTTDTSTLRLTYASIYIDQNDEPEDRLVWSKASKKAQNTAACSYHVNYGGTAPAWAIR